MKSIQIYKTGELDPSGVTQVWKWKCNHWLCLHSTANYGIALYWVNAVKGANYHIKWHQNKHPYAKI